MREHPVSFKKKWEEKWILMFFSNLVQVRLAVLDLRKPAASFKHVCFYLCFFLFFALHICHAGAVPEVLSLFFPTTATAIIISMVTHWKCFAAFKAERTTINSRRVRRALSFSFCVQLFSSHQLFIHDPLAKESKLELGDCSFSRAL